MTIKRPKSAENGKLGGRPRLTIAERNSKRPDKSGLISIRIDPAKEMVIPVDIETRVLAQTLMLREWEGVTTVEELFSYAVRRLADKEER